MSDKNWEEIKIEYITSNISQRNLAEKCGVPYRTLLSRALDEKWFDEKKKYREKVVAKAVSKIAGKNADKLTKLIETTEDAIDVVAGAFSDDRQFNRYVLANGQEVESEKLDTRALKDITAVLKDLTGLMRDFYNIPTPAQAEAQRVAAERLKLEQMRNQPEDDEDNIEVIFNAGPEEWNE